MRPIVDYVVVIPLDEEFGYVRGVVQRSLKHKISSKTIGTELYSLALLPTVSRAASTVILTVGRMTEAPVQSAVENAIRTWRPAAIVMVGIAGSLEPDKVKLGDVIVPSKVFGYTEAKAEVVDGKERLTYRPTGHQLDCELSAQARAVRLDHVGTWRAASRRAGRADPEIKPRILAKDGKEGPKLHMTNNDCIASGNTVVATKAFADGVRKALGDAGTTVRAVEMEAKGLCEAVTRIRPAPAALVVRGISDYADEKKAELEKDFKDGWRRYAAQNASRFVLELINRRPEIAEGYRSVACPAFPMKPHRESARLCMEARIQAREAKMRFIAFNPFMVCPDGLPATELTLEARRVDDSPIPFADLLLRHADEGGRILVRMKSAPKVTHRFDRTGDPPALELLVGLPEEAVAIALAAKDEFGRETRAQWRSPE